jgi:hypothetical protein
MERLMFLWAASGVVAHIANCNDAKTWCGTPIWQEPLTYVMFGPAMLLGPIMFLLPK